MRRESLARPLECCLEAFERDRLHDVVNRLKVECFECKVVVGSLEDDQRLGIGQVTRDIEAIHLRHGDVEQDDVRLASPNQLECFDTVRGLPHHLDVELVQHDFQPPPGGGFVIHNEHTHVSSPRDIP